MKPEVIEVLGLDGSWLTGDVLLLPEAAANRRWAIGTVGTGRVRLLAPVTGRSVDAGRQHHDEYVPVKVTAGPLLNAGIVHGRNGDRTPKLSRDAGVDDDVVGEIHVSASVDEDGASQRRRDDVAIDPCADIPAAVRVSAVSAMQQQ